MRLQRKLAQVLLICILFVSVVVTTSVAYVVPSLQVELRQGIYKGQLESGVEIWRGIQFATAPRFQAPGKMPDKTSDSVINAFTHGKSTSGVTGGDPDCLNLAVYVNPSDTGKAKHVFMWLFGSANAGGSPSASDWAKFVAYNPDIIVVTPNYRGGRYGSIDLRKLQGYNNYKDASGHNPYDVSNNVARLDVLEALKWINENIAAFGGDPNDVSIGGHSSGSNLCLAVMMMPESAPYWKRSLNQESFPLDSSLMPLDAAQQIAQGVFAQRDITKIVYNPPNPPITVVVGVAPAVMTMDQFLTQTHEQLTATAITPAGFGYKLLSPVIDNVVIKENYYELVLDGLWKGKQILLGSNNGTYDQMYSNPDTAIATAIGRNPGNLSSTGWHGYPIGNPGESNYIPNYADWIVAQYISHNSLYNPPRTLLTTGKDLDADMQMRVPALLFAEAASLYTDVYFYHNTFVSDPTTRAAHGSENTVIMRTYVPPKATDPALVPALVTAANRFSDIWATFIRTGNPNFGGLGTTWTPYDGLTRNTMILTQTNPLYMVNGVRNEDIDLLMPLTREYPLLVTSTTPTASVKKLNGNKNELTITITEELISGRINVYKGTFTINNNAAGTYTVDRYRVFVDTKGNTQIRECYIVG
jgi:para-nitrobenzyl esterase